MKAEAELNGIDPMWPLQKKLEHVRRLGINWYGGADLSKLHDLTAAALCSTYKDIDIIIPIAGYLCVLLM